MSSPQSFSTSALALAGRIADSPILRAVNFHNTPRTRTSEYEEQLKQLSRDFSPVREDDLDVYLATGKWNQPRPGVIVAVYEGYRNGFDVLLPLLERYGLVGWFFVITGFVEAPTAEQRNFAADHGIDMATREYPDGRYAMTWDEVRQVDRQHVVACHTRSHMSLATFDSARRESEVAGTQKTFEERLGHPVRSFASYGGPAYGEDPATDRWIDRAGYQFVFSNFRIQRLRKWPRT